MTIALMEGFELGSNFAENQQLSKNVWTQTSFVNATSTFTVGASTMGSGRSMKMAMFGNSTTVSNRPALTVPISIDLANAPVGYKFGWGLRAKLNPNKSNAANGFLMLRDTAAGGPAGGFLINCTTNIAATSNAVMTYTMNSTGTGTFTVPDLLTHYYTFSHTKLATNTYAVEIHLDNTLAVTFTGTTTLTTTPVFGFMQDGTTATVQANLFAEVDDLYFVMNQGPLGDISIQRITPTTDSQADWTVFGAAASNHAAVDRISLDASTGIQTSTSGATDLYGNATVLPSGKRIIATKTTVYGTGDPANSIEALGVNGSATGNGTATPLSQFGVVADTGWNTALANLPLSSYEFGVQKV